MNATPQQIQHLATRMGLTAVLDASGGYDVVRVIVSRDGVAHVFDPAHNSLHAIELMCWAMANGVNIRNDEVFWYQGHNDLIAKRISHDNTPPSLSAAILAAALRVAGET